MTFPWRVMATQRKYKGPEAGMNANASDLLSGVQGAASSLWRQAGLPLRDENGGQPGQSQVF